GSLNSLCLGFGCERRVKTGCSREGFHRPTKGFHQAEELAYGEVKRVEKTSLHPAHVGLGERVVGQANQSLLREPEFFAASGDRRRPRRNTSSRLAHVPTVGQCRQTRQSRRINHGAAVYAS